MRRLGYLVIDEANQTMFAIDGADPEALIPVLREEEETHARELVGILTTHKHGDHSGGNLALSKLYPDVPMVGSKYESTPACTQPVGDGDQFNMGAVKITALHTPCHTMGHLVYVVTGDAATPPLLFSGDTLFVGGCGKFFEGSAEDMYHSLYERILCLPDETKLYCGHEYKY
jgi:hydroxyacylglutathione hydrolase